MAILVQKVPGDLPMLAKKANFLRLSTMLEFTFIFYHLILVVVSAPVVLILFVLFMY